MDRLTLLKSTTFGSQVAEDEVQFLENYFVQTDLWSRIIGGSIDIVRRGKKGSGKSAIYLLLGTNRDALFDRKILQVSAEKP